jgi:hypothetical protein
VVVAYLGDVEQWQTGGSIPRPVIFIGGEERPGPARHRQPANGSPKRMDRIKNPESKTAFEFGPNLLGFNLIWKNSGKFLKILSCLDLPECEFRLTWLYSEISSFHTSST